MIPTLRDAAQQALEALEWADNAMYEGTPIQVNTQKAITALRAALAEQPAQQEPVAWMNDEGDVELSHKPWMSSVWLPLYTSPPQREPLTDAEIGQVRWQCRWNRMSTDDNVVYATTQQLDAFARAAIAAYERINVYAAPQPAKRHRLQG